MGLSLSHIFSKDLCHDPEMAIENGNSLKLSHRNYASAPKLSALTGNSCTMLLLYHIAPSLPTVVARFKMNHIGAITFI